MKSLLFVFIFAVSFTAQAITEGETLLALKLRMMNERIDRALKLTSKNPQYHACKYKKMEDLKFDVSCLENKASIEFLLSSNNIIVNGEQIQLDGLERKEDMHASIESSFLKKLRPRIFMSSFFQLPMQVAFSL